MGISQEERRKAMRRMMDVHGMSLREIGRKFGLSEDEVREELDREEEGRDEP